MDGNNIASESRFHSEYWEVYAWKKPTQ